MSAANPTLKPQPVFPPGAAILVKEIHTICEWSANRMTLYCGKCGEVLFTTNGWRCLPFDATVNEGIFGTWLKEHPCFHIRPKEDAA